METPERIYLYKKADPLDAIQMCSPLNFDGSVEYIQKDIAEEMAKEAMRYYDQSFYSYLLGHRKLIDINQLFTEFINSRKNEVKNSGWNKR